MDVTSRGQRAQDVEMAGRDARQAEQGHASGEVDEGGVVAEARAGAVDALGRVRHGDARAQAPEQLGLPAEVGPETAARAVLVAAGDPCADHLGTMQGVPVEEIGQVAHDARTGAPGEPGPAAPACGAEMRREALDPRLVQAPVHDLEKGPDRAFRAATDPSRRRCRKRSRPRRRRGGGATGRRRSRRRRRPARASRRAGRTCAGSATAPSRGSGPPRPRARTGRRADRRAGRRAPRRGRPLVRRGGRGARLSPPPSGRARRRHHRRTIARRRAGSRRRDPGRRHRASVQRMSPPRRGS